jgi:hypothetical protein
MRAAHRLLGVAADPGVGEGQSEQWFSEGGPASQAHDSELLIDPVPVHTASCICASCDVLISPEEYNLDQQEKMEPPVALINGETEVEGDHFEDLLQPLEDTAPEASGNTWDSP